MSMYSKLHRFNYNTRTFLYEIVKINKLINFIY